MMIGTMHSIEIVDRDLVCSIIDLAETDKIFIQTWEAHYSNPHVTAPGNTFAQCHA
jgi:hypothetical protein